jgi:hypothetical protein
MSRGQWVALIAGIAVALYAGSRVIGPGRTGGFGKPPKQAVPDDDDDWYAASPHPDYPLLCHPDQHPAGVVFTAHRFPGHVGGQITTVIHRGWSTFRVPDRVPGVQWIVAPPSEVSL